MAAARIMASKKTLSFAKRKRRDTNWLSSMTSSRATRWIIFWSSLQHRDFFDDRPRRAGQISEQWKIGIGSGSLRTRPCSFHRLAILEIEFDNRIPTGVVALGIGTDVVLKIAP